jgi:hypothetical protein
MQELQLANRIEMKFFSFTSGKVVDAFARQLAQDFFNACSKPGVAPGKDKTFEKKADQVLIAIYARALCPCKGFQAGKTAWCH